MAAQTIVFLGSKPVGAACFKALLDVVALHDAEVIAAATQERPEFSGTDTVATVATQHGIRLLTPGDKIPECDFLISVQYHRILKAEELLHARKLAVNLHLAPLPEYRGCNQFSFAILEGRSEFGVTLHEMDARIDHGDVLFQKRFPIPEHCWVDQLYELTVQHGIALFERHISDILAGTYVRYPQADLPGTPSLHFRHEIAELKNIPIGLDAEAFSRRLRATLMPGFPPPFSMVGGRKIFYQTARETDQ